MPLEYITKRNGAKQAVDWSKVDGMLNLLNSYPTQLSCNASFISDRVREIGVDKDTPTKMLSERCAKVAQELASQNPDFLELSARISVCNHHRNTLDCFSSTMEACYRNRKTVGRGRNAKSVPAPRINTKLYKFVHLHKTRLNRMVDYERDYRFTDFGFAALMDRYLIKRGGPKHLIEQRPQDYAIERPQDMWMRVACAIHMNRNNLADTSVLAEVQETYDLLSLGYIMHATPTLYNAGTLCEQLLSCYLLGCEDSIEGIGKMNADMLKLSKHSGGIGWWWPLRSSGSEVSMTNGTSGGPEPFLRCIEASMRAANQGGKRPGSAANYVQPTDPDIMRWLRLKRADEPDHIKDIFYAIWCHDEFMQRVVDDAPWYLVDPNEQPLLGTLLGEEYSREYRRIIEAEEYKGEPLMARDVLMEACITQAEAGMPYMLFADACNSKSNMQNVMPVRCSNLCAEILIPSSSKEYGCCAVSSVCVNRCVIECDCLETEEKWIPGAVAGHQLGCNGRMRMDYDKLAYCEAVLVRNLNKITDINYYPVEEARRSQMRHRPLGIGCQGLADAFHLLAMPFTSREAKAENKRIFESLYHGGVRESMLLAKRDGPYETFRGDPINNPTNPHQLSPAAEGQLQFDLWGLKETDLMGKWDWTTLKANVVEHGLRNAYITALPPTASTSHIQGNNECHEPYTDNIYVRKTLSGENLVINHHLVKDLRVLGLWTPQLRAKLIEGRGSVQAIPGLPAWLKLQYLTVWELRNRDLVDMDADRAPFVDQTQSSNRFMADPTAKKLFAMHIYCWRKGLKTGMYYLRSQSKSKATQFSEAIKVKPEKKDGTIDIPAEKIDYPVISQSVPAEEAMMCQLKKVNGITCYTCQ